MTRVDDSPVPDYASRLSLADRSFIVMGAGNGMGRQAAHALAAVGARLVCVDQDPGLAEDIAKEVSGLGLALDMTDRGNVQAVVDRAVAEHGHLDGLVDIIGIARWMELLDIDDETWNFEFDVCLRHAFLAMQIAGRAMRETGGGAMAFVASISGLHSAPNHAAYGAAKAALMALVRTGGVELGKHGIRVNAVAPGATATPVSWIRSLANSSEPSSAYWSGIGDQTNIVALGNSTGQPSLFSPGTSTSRRVL